MLLNVVLSQKRLLMTKSYQKLCTEFYDITKSEACKQEIIFYSEFMKNAHGPILEAMCGSGRLLIPLLKKGFQIDGVDDSHDMLESCSKRCAAHKLSPHLYQQSMQHLNLPEKYALIFIALGSFQLITDRNAALAVLHKLYDHLMPGGILLIDTYIPWDSIHENINGCYISHQPKMMTSTREVKTEDGSDLILKSITTIYANEQLELIESRYEKRGKQKVLAVEEEHLAVRWYYRYEMELFLEKAGYSNIRLHEVSFQYNPQGRVFEAKKKA